MASPWQLASTRVLAGLVLVTLVAWHGIAHGQVVAPTWAQVAPSNLPDGHYLGEATSTQGEREALTAATGQALAAFAQTLGVEVQSELESIQSYENGSDSHSIHAVVRTRGVPVTIRDARVDKKEVGRDDSGYRAWVDVAVPKAERERLQRLAIGRTQVALSCDLDGQTTCPLGVSDLLRSAFSQAGLSLADRSADRATTCAQARDSGAAYLLQVVVQAEYLANSGDEWFGRATCHVEWMDTTDEKALISASAGPLKGGHYSRADAVAAAAQVAVKDLVQRVTKGDVRFVRSADR